MLKRFHRLEEPRGPQSSKLVEAMNRLAYANLARLASQRMACSFFPAKTIFGQLQNRCSVAWHCVLLPNSPPLPPSKLSKISSPQATKAHGTSRKGTCQENRLMFLLGPGICLDRLSQRNAKPAPNQGSHQTSTKHMPSGKSQREALGWVAAALQKKKKSHAGEQTKAKKSKRQLGVSQKCFVLPLGWYVNGHQKEGKPDSQTESDNMPKIGGLPFCCFLLGTISPTKTTWVAEHPKPQTLRPRPPLSSTLSPRLAHALCSSTMLSACGRQDTQTQRPSACDGPRPANRNESQKENPAMKPSVRWILWIGCL